MTSDGGEKARKGELELAKALAGHRPGPSVRAVIWLVRNREQNLNQGFNPRDFIIEGCDEDGGG